MPAFEVVLDRGAYSADAIQRAAYKYCRNFSLELTTDERSFRCVLHSRQDPVPEAVVAAFLSEVLDQVLRERIRTETAAVRNLILALAFADAPIGDEID